MRRLLAAAGAAALALVAAAPATAAPNVRYGVQDDAWLATATGAELERRLALLQRLGVTVVRYTLRWDRVAARRPSNPRSPNAARYDWNQADEVLNGLRKRRIAAVVTIYGTPRWANRGRGPQFAPVRGRDLGDFAYAAGRRYRFVKRWTVWNEPNQRRFLRPTTPRAYVRRVLNPAYAQLHRAVPRVRVAGGVTAPRGGPGGVSPVSWIRGMRAARARLDAYAHHPYPERPGAETPWSGGCPYCRTITMATLERLLVEVRRAFGRKPIWLTEYGYQTNPPQPRPLGVPPAVQAAHLASAARRVHAAPRVELLIHFLVQDDSARHGWQSGLLTAAGRPKPSFRAFMLPLTQKGRSGARATLWGQVRPRTGRQPYRIRVSNGRGGWRWATRTRWTGKRGFFEVRVRAGKGARAQLWSPRDRTFSPVVSLR